MLVANKVFLCKHWCIGFIEKELVRISSWWCRLRRKPEGFRSSSEAVYPVVSVRQLVCQGFRPATADHQSRWGLCLYRFVCTPSRPAVVLSPGTRVLPPYSSTDSDHYTGTIYIVIGVWLETHIKPHIFFLFFFVRFLPYVGFEVSRVQVW